MQPESRYLSGRTGEAIPPVCRKTGIPLKNK